MTTPPLPFSPHAPTSLGPREITIPGWAPLGNTALLFDGANDYVEIDEVTMASGDATLELWVCASATQPSLMQVSVKGKDTELAPVAGQWGDKSNSSLGVWLDADGYLWASRYVGSASTWVGPLELEVNDGDYHRVVASRCTQGGASYLQLAVDHQYLAVQDPLDSIPKTTGKVSMGLLLEAGTPAALEIARRKLGGFRGALTRVSLWNQGFNMRETTLHYDGDGTNPLPKPPTNPQALTSLVSLALGQWLCNEGYGGWAFDSVVGSGRHGKLSTLDASASPGPRWSVAVIRDRPMELPAPPP